MGSGSGKPYRFLHTSPTELPGGQEGAGASGPPDSLPRASGLPPTPRLSLASKLGNLIFPPRGASALCVPGCPAAEMCPEAGFTHHTGDYLSTRRTHSPNGPGASGDSTQA